MSARLIAWTPEAWEDYLYWQANDPSKATKVNTLVKDILRQPFQGLGKPELLRFDFAGYWSRRIDGEHRLLYRVTDEMIRITACRYYY